MTGFSRSLGVGVVVLILGGWLSGLSSRASGTEHYFQILGVVTTERGKEASPGRLTYTILYAGFIIFFTYFYTAIVFNPVDLADNMKKYGGFIPGVRPGRKTAEYIDRTLTRITLPGAVFLALISVLPDFLIRWFNVPFYFGGTSLLIVVGVALDTVRQMESHLLMRHYEGFLRRKKLAKT
jgi:preprotein translocase subunit SecY